MERMVEKLAAAGVPITLDAVLAQARPGAVRRPHIADALVAAGTSPGATRPSTTCSTTAARTKVRHYAPDAIRAVRLRARGRRRW